MLPFKGNEQRSLLTLPPPRMQHSKSLSTPQLWQRCTSLVFYFIFAPFYILKWFWSFLPRTSTLRGEADEVRQERRRNGKDRGRRDSILDFRPPPRWLVRILVLPLAMLNPPDARHLEHVVRCVDRGEKILLVGNQVRLPSAKVPKRDPGIDQGAIKYLFPLP